MAFKDFNEISTNGRRVTFVTQHTGYTTNQWYVYANDYGGAQSSPSQHETREQAVAAAKLYARNHGYDYVEVS